MKVWLFMLLWTGWGTYIHAQACAPVVRPTFSADGQKDLEQKLQAAKADFEKDSSRADALIWLGRRTAYLGMYEEAIRIFTQGIARHPSDARLYRHRGHRYITLRCFDKAIRDFTTAAALVQGTPDETEPDGMPNALNVPTSTLQSNIWYHLGLAYFLTGDYSRAADAYRACLKVSANPDMYVATANWLNLTLRKLGKNEEAEALLRTIDPAWKLIENGDYLKIIQLFRTGPACSQLVTAQEGAHQLSSATYAFGAGSYCSMSGDTAAASALWHTIIKGNQWSSFAYIAAEQALKQLP